MSINYPFLPPGIHFKYIDIQNPFMQAAMKVAKDQAFLTNFEPKTPVGIVFVKDGKILVSSANGSNYHQEHGCERKKLGIPSGQRYDLCPGCDYASHAEPKAIQFALENKLDLNGADLYLFGEWWICEPCWTAISQKFQIGDIYLLQNSEKYFNRDHPESKCGDFEFFEQQTKKGSN